MRPEVEGLAGASNCKTRIFCWELGGHDVFSGVHIVIILCIDWCAETTNNWTDPFAQTPIVSAEVKTWHWLTDYPTSCIDSFSVKLCAIFVWCDSMWCPFPECFIDAEFLLSYIYIHIIILYYIQYILERERESHVLPMVQQLSRRCQLQLIGVLVAALSGVGVDRVDQTKPW